MYGSIRTLGDTFFFVAVFILEPALSMKLFIMQPRIHSEGIARFPLACRYECLSACSEDENSLILFSSSSPLNLCMRMGVVPTILHLYFFMLDRDVWGNYLKIIMKKRETILNSTELYYARLDITELDFIILY